jgi:hypothetical protein
VKRWRNGKMVLRWGAAALLVAEAGFRRIQGYAHLPQLKAALMAHQNSQLTLEPSRIMNSSTNRFSTKRGTFPHQIRTSLPLLPRLPARQGPQYGHPRCAFDIRRSVFGVRR